MENKSNNTPDFWDELSETQKKSIEISIEQLNKGNGIPHQEAICQLRNFLEWKQLSLEAMEINKAIKEASIDLDKIWDEARRKSWNEFKENRLIDIDLEQIENGQTMSPEEVQDKIKRWFADKIKEEQLKKK